MLNRRTFIKGLSAITLIPVLGIPNCRLKTTVTAPSMVKDWFINHTSDQTFAGTQIESYNGEFAHKGNLGLGQQFTKIFSKNDKIKYHVTGIITERNGYRYSFQASEVLKV